MKQRLADPVPMACLRAILIPEPSPAWSSFCSLRATGDLRGHTLHFWEFRLAKPMEQYQGLLLVKYTCNPRHEHAPAQQLAATKDSKMNKKTARRAPQRIFTIDIFTQACLSTPGRARRSLHSLFDTKPSQTL